MCDLTWSHRWYTIHAPESWSKTFILLCLYSIVIGAITGYTCAQKWECTKEFYSNQASERNSYNWLTLSLWDWLLNLFQLRSPKCGRCNQAVHNKPSHCLGCQCLRRCFPGQRKACPVRPLRHLWVYGENCGTIKTLSLTDFWIYLLSHCCKCVAHHMKQLVEYSWTKNKN